MAYQYGSTYTTSMVCQCGAQPTSYDSVLVQHLEVDRWRNNVHKQHLDGNLKKILT